jgi:putative DNA primase/helicase
MTDFGSLMRDVAPLLGYDPGRADRKGIARYRARGSLRIDYRQGLWSDYEAGEAGGVFDFIKYATGERPVEWLRRNRLDAAAPVARATGQRRRPHDFGAERRDPTDEERERIEFAFALWEDAHSAEGVTAVHDYLASRCLELGDTSQFRFHPKTPWRPPGEALQPRACLLAAYRNLDDDQVTGLSRILLDEPPHWPKTRRMMLGVVRRAAVKLVPVTDELAVGEGVETAMAANRMGYGPAWALGSAGAIANLPVLPNIKRLTLLAENNAASRAATERCAQRWLKAGRRVTRVWPRPECDDLNDELIFNGEHHVD